MKIEKFFSNKPDHFIPPTVPCCSSIGSNNINDNVRFCNVNQRRVYVLLGQKSREMIRPWHENACRCVIEGGRWLRVSICSIDRWRIGGSNSSFDTPRWNLSNRNNRLFRYADCFAFIFAKPHMVNNRFKIPTSTLCIPEAERVLLKNVCTYLQTEEIVLFFLLVRQPGSSIASCTNKHINSEKNVYNFLVTLCC